MAESEIVCVTTSPFPRSRVAHGRTFRSPRLEDSRLFLLF
jgi:hypothetical protein